MQDRIIVNNYIENDPLSEENLDKTLDLVNKIRLSTTQKSIWLYTGYSWNDIWCNETALRDNHSLDYNENVSINHIKRQQIVSQSDVLVDGRYMDSQRDITLKWRGSKNQNVIDIKESLRQKKVILWCN